MDSFYLICFSLGLVLSILSVLGGFAHLHIGRIHIGHLAHGHTHHGAARQGSGLSAVNGFTIMAFLCWFGGTGYLLHHFSIFVAPLVVLLAALGGFAGAAILWVTLFKLLLPHERILTSEETEMAGVLAHVSDAIRDGNGVGEIIFPKQVHVVPPQLAAKMATRSNAAPR
jgi:hypothetical protein